MAQLEVRGVNKSFGGLRALNDINLTVEPGKVHAIIGPNGAGKSTLLNCLIGRLEPDTGDVTFEGRSIVGHAPHEINQLGLARVFQTPEIFGELTLLENVMIPAFAHRDGSFKLNAWSRVDAQAEVRDAAEHMLEDFNLIAKKGHRADSLSRGDKRRLELAMCLIQKPKIMLLDEPTAGMSRADTNATIDLLKRIGDERGVTKVVIEHDMHVVFSLAEKVTVMAQGAILVEDKPENIKGNPKVQEAYLGGAHI
jgi:branched-chain amino acid transport system ATP-binding protein